MLKNLLLRWSLRRTVLTLLVPALSVIAGVELWAAYRSAVDAANSAYDRSLLGAIKAIDANISTASGGVAVEMPYTMLEFFELTASGQVFFRVGTEDGLIEVGNSDMPKPAKPLKTRVPQFYDAEYFGDKVRVGAYARELDKPLGNRTHERIVIQVAETLTSRAEFIRKLVLQAAGRDILLLAAAGGLLAMVLHFTLQPLSRLREEVAARSPLDLTPIGTAAVPVDVQPLVEAINQHMARNQQIMEARRRFVDDASHQLRTPLATLRTQLDYALRENDPANVRLALDAVSKQLDDATYRTNQMLSLARADAAELTMSTVDLCALAELVAREVVLQARDKRIDLEYDAPDEPVWISGHAGLLREAALNLLHNAIRFAPERGHVSLRVSAGEGQAMLAVTDNGPGIPPDQLPRLGERFFRATNAVSSGSGLGLAIARAVAERCGGKLVVANVASGTGCVVVLMLPLASGDDRQPIDRIALLQS
ncbi:MAG TPA: sensor histidine kinase N-terminal domain-containing protein [Noviherbaspirillum sp.]|uniref:sensor histidine kinase N-terminal domain-containing protein n=1 Tax=Noviherbaspirillum sp. TaxID=1926288 RepID=UPI002B473BED|nr:sensor histidine kinase N-terminal domain-containing protein [Noviherbaspirillum sp.]HJV85987.1 sensor histidine kinase N-terminal domain-containing protein [Noviherbaspirillum sp.]